MSKFANLRAMREQRQTELPQEEAPSPLPAEPTASTRKVGRPPGKRSDPNYQQVTVLLRSQTYRAARKRLLDEDKEVSELLNELLDAWLNS